MTKRNSWCAYATNWVPLRGPLGIPEDIVQPKTYVQHKMRVTSRQNTRSMTNEYAFILEVFASERAREGERESERESVCVCVCVCVCAREHISMCATWDCVRVYSCLYTNVFNLIVNCYEDIFAPFESCECDVRDSFLYGSSTQSAPRRISKVLCAPCKFLRPETLTFRVRKVKKKLTLRMDSDLAKRSKFLF